MMSSNMGLKSLLLTLTMLTAMPTQVMCADNTVDKGQNSSNPPKAMFSFVVNNKIAFIGLAAWFIIDTRLRTRPRAEFSTNDLKQDFKDLLASLNIFEGNLVNQLVYMFDKYIIGLPIKLDDATTRTIKEDGTIVAVKGKKLTQKPFGLYGLFDAYVLTQMKKFTDNVPVVAGFYVLLNDSLGVFAQAITNAQGTKSGQGK